MIAPSAILIEPQGPSIEIEPEPATSPDSRTGALTPSSTQSLLDRSTCVAGRIGPQNRGALLAALGADQRHALLGQKLSGLRKRTLGRQLRTLSKQNLKVFARQMNVTRGYLNFNQSGTRDGIQYSLNNLFHTQSPLLSVLIVHTSQMHTHHDVHSARHAVEFLNDVSTRTLLTLPKCLIGGNFGLTHLGAQAV